MNLKVYKSSLQGSFNVPPSKSHTLRAIVLACFAKTPSKIENALNSGDVQTAIKIFSELTCKFQITNKALDSFDLEVFPPTCGLVHYIQKNQNKTFTIDCGNSGTLLYFLTVIFSFCDGITFTFIGDESLQTRPLTPITEIFTKRGLHFKSDKFPFTFAGKKCETLSLNLEGVFSQSISGLFLATVIFNLDLTLRLRVLGEKPYVLMTANWLNFLGFCFKNFNCTENFFELNAKNKILNGFTKKIFSDWSAVVFPVLAAIATKSELMINAISDKTQGDYRLLEYLKSFGVSFNIDEKSITILKNQNINQAKISLKENPDLLPALCTLACFANGKTEIENIQIARFKETDRVKTICTELKKFGINIVEFSDKVIIEGKTQKYFTSQILDSHKDHRIAMTLIAFALGCDNYTIIRDYDCYKISYPTFLQQIKNCGGEFK